MTRDLHLSLSDATTKRSEIEVLERPIGLRSFFTRDHQVVCGLPGSRFTGLRCSARDFLTGVFSGSLRMWPRNLILLFLMVLLHGIVFVFSYSLTFDTRSALDIPIILRRKLR